MVVVMDHQKCLTATGMQTKCASAVLPFNRGSPNSYAKNMCFLSLQGFFFSSAAMANDHIVMNQLKNLSNNQFSDQQLQMLKVFKYEKKEYKHSAPQNQLIKGLFSFSFPFSSNHKRLKTFVFKESCNSLFSSLSTETDT